MLATRQSTTMHIDFQSLCEDYSVAMAPHNHKHSRSGWVNVSCPFCTGSHDGYHLGYCATEAYFKCWRCGWHPHWEVVAALTGCARGAADGILTKYRTRVSELPLEQRAPQEPILRPKVCKLPPGCAKLGAERWTDAHRRYLTHRKYDSDQIANTWRLVCAGALAGTYRWRVIAPIYFQGRLVSYQGRDITGRSPLRYRACAKERETRDHKTCLYGYDEAVASGYDKVVVVEGITDVWRIGVGAVATFGIEYTAAQRLLLARTFKSVAVLFDEDCAAQAKARALANELRIMGLRAQLVDLPECEDPGLMSQALVRELRENILSRDSSKSV